MPGMTVVCANGGTGPETLSNAEARLQKLAEERGHRARIFRPHPGVVVCQAGYAEYSFAVLSVGAWQFYIEGHLYDVPDEDLPRRLAEVVAALEAGGDRRLSLLGEWIDRRDGKCVMVAVHRERGETWVMNDHTARLPVYWTNMPGGRICTRDIGFLSHPSWKRGMDGSAAAMYLLLRYPLGTRTLLDGVQTLEPASLLRLHDVRSTPPAICLRPLEFGRYDEGMGSPRAAAKRVAGSFLADLSARARQADPCLVSLSGGLDSRAVAAGLAQVAPSTTAVTFLDAAGRAALDVQYAEAVAKALGLRWELYPLEPPTLRDAHEVFRQKYAHCGLVVTFIYSFYAQLVDRYGTGANFFTGDGGDKVLPCLEPSGRLHGVPDTVDYLLGKNHLWPIEQVARFTGMPERSLRAGIEERLLSYPEERMAHKVVHFMIRERAMRWVFESEDRDRCHMQSLSPFFGWPFFQLAMSVPARWKRDYVFYREFLNVLSREAADVPNASWRMSLNRRVAVKSIFVLNRLTNHLMPEGMKEALKRRYRHAPATFSHREDIMRAVGRFCDELAGPASGVIDWEEVRKAQPATAEQAYFLLSLAALAAQLRGSPLTLGNMDPAELP